jgi:hypothetical protein
VTEALAHSGHIEEVLRPVDQGIDPSQADWPTPEFVSPEGELLLARRTCGAAESAEPLFRRGRDEARRQGALSWELGATTSLAGLLRGQSRPGDAFACLQPVYDRFTEGFAAADLVAAKRLLDDLGYAARRLGSFLMRIARIRGFRL